MSLPLLSPGVGLVLVRCNTLRFRRASVRLFRGRESPRLCNGFALRALPEGYNIGTMGVGSPRMILRKTLPVEVPVRLQHGGIWCCCLPTDFSRFLVVVAVKLRHDAHLSALCHLFGTPGL
ncbi:hypothetical protein EVAR_73667_1 [Eumeta japonica]|uniref:Uncharacterized protein n=1 Tax=Eumeta variegata TaxID=151549 RepID=A0A4C1TUS6_EUMVA|nr:hypothetical protein EVAR_73667_1 [Eumeta japonica]